MLLPGNNFTFNSLWQTVTDIYKPSM